MSVPVQDIGGKCENSDGKGEQPNGRTNKGKYGGAKGKSTETPRKGGNGRAKQTEKKNEETNGKKNKVKVAAKSKGGQRKMKYQITKKKFCQTPALE